jgi:hypothetical protein
MTFILSIVSPNAKQIAFVESDFDAGETIVKVVATNGGPVRDLVRLPGTTESPYGQAIFALAWGPESEAIYFVPPDDSGRQLTLQRVTVQDRELKLLGPLIEAPRAFGLSVRQDGRQLQFALTAGESIHDEAWVLRGLSELVTR